MAHQIKLMKVKGNNCHLQWPVPPFPEDQRSRGGQGYVVDLGHPLECGYDVPVLAADGMPHRDGEGRPIVKHITGWCEGQLHKLEDAPEGSVPSEINLPAARMAMNEYEAARAPKVAKAPAPIPTAETRATQPAKRKNHEPVEVIEGG
jgi:hypothetical protein